VFVPFDPDARVHVGVVALGTAQRLQDCLDGLVAHESRHEFVVSCLVNPLTVDEAPITIEVPDGVRLLRSAANLGWAGGLQRLRPLVDADYFVWGQDDMVPEPGWLDALVDAADGHPRVGAFGAVGLGADGEVVLHNGGMAEPPGDVAGWSSTDATPTALPEGVTVLDWVTSKGCLTRAEAFDEIGGPDPRLWPLNRVDLDFSTHLRCHGWEVALVPTARLRHVGSQSAPSPFRTFLLEWRDGWFDRQWAASVTALHGRSAGEVPHPCAPWRSAEADAVEVAAGREASKMVVPFARFQARLLQESQATLDEHAAALARMEAEGAAQRETIAQLEERLHRSRARRRRLKRRVARLEARLAGRPSAQRAPVRRRLARRLRP
jgi:GT2 family glycosyltransferase